MIEFKSEASIWEMMAELNPFTGGSAKPFDMRRWDITDERMYRLSWGSIEGKNYQLGEEPNDLPWYPDEKEVGFTKRPAKVSHSSSPAWSFQIGRLVGRSCCSADALLRPANTSEPKS